MIRIGHIFGAGQDRHGELDALGTAYCMAAISAYFRKKIDKISIAVGPKCRRAGILMGDKMKSLLIGANIPPDDIIFYPYGENGAGEAHACIERARRLYGNDFSLIPIIGRFYMPRMWIIFRKMRIRPSRWIIIQNKASMEYLFWEIPKTFGTIFHLHIKRVPVPQY